MPRLKLAISRIFIGVFALLLMVAYPPHVFADGPTGPDQPTGADANTYHYNDDTGMWENDYYIWDPVTQQTTPKTTQTYSYNPDTGMWDTTDWIYDAPSGKYVPNVVSVSQPPASAITDTGPGSNNTINNNGSGGGSISNTGPNSNNQLNNNGTNNGIFNNFYNASISNTLNSQAHSGNALVVGNTNGGGALSGNAQAVAALINLLQSATNVQGDLASFSKDIYGDVQGDIMIDPSQVPSSSSIATNGSPTNLTINSQGSGEINNDVTINAGSGNATVSGNTRGGDATTGSATAMADIVNVINSIINSGKSFVGSINIYGNLDGDILMPQDTLNKLLAAATAANANGSNSISNTGPTSNNQINNQNPSNTNINNTNTTGINNDVTLSAASGNATVDHNTLAGDATTGQAGTDLTILNLTGQQIIGDNALLVFVNVMGKWVGMIVNAPEGSTSAALGGGISSISSLPSGNTTINNTTNNKINNKLNLAAASGDANVSNNTEAGNARSGDARAAASIMNISNTTLALNKWLGILFINVFGSWNGSFGIDTAAGNRPVAFGGTNNNPAVTEAVKAVKVFSFVPTTGNSGTTYHTVQLASATNPSMTGGVNNDQNHKAVLASSTSNQSNPPAASVNNGSILWTAGSLAFLAGVLGVEEVVNKRRAAALRAREYINSITVQPLKRY